MKVKKLNKNQVEKLQNETDDYCRKSGTGIGVKIIAGLSLVVTTVMLLVGCTPAEEAGPYSEVSNDGTSQGHNFSEDLTMKNEQDFEQKLAQHLSEKTGLNVEVYDITKVTLIRNEKGNFLSFEGGMITDVLKGENQAVLTIQISAEKADALQEIMDKPGFRYNNGTRSGGLIYDERSFAVGYGYNLLNELDSAVHDDSSKILSVFDKDATNFTYTHDGLEK